jgi:hypothetical protein
MQPAAKQGRMERLPDCLDQLMAALSLVDRTTQQQSSKGPPAVDDGVELQYSRMYDRSSFDAQPKSRIVK